MQQDRRHLVRRTDRRTSRDTLANRTRTPTRHSADKPIRDAQRRRGLGAWRVPPRASTRPSTQRGDVPTCERQVHGARCRRSVRGAALLDVMFTLTALMAGAQGFAHWQAVGGMTSTELAATPRIVSMAMPSTDSGDAPQIRHPR
ncbi:hypothetical protein [Pandoraea sp. NPDC087047]|uniref:hypothetical protein n=1 Tax=Pandoraea sp. NPDC087047 TaxID=3364390 RepID=UPI00381BB050